MKTLLHLLIIFSVYLCSFSEVANTKQLTQIITINSSFAAFSVPNCVERIEEQAICEGIKESYNQCISDGEDPIECAEVADDTVEATESAELQEQMAQMQSLSSLDDTSNQLFIQIAIIIVSEIISGWSRVKLSVQSGSAWMHALAASLLLLYFVIFGIGYKEWGEGALEKKTSYTVAMRTLFRQGSPLMKMQKKCQIELINQEINTLESLSSIYSSHA